MIYVISKKDCPKCESCKKHLTDMGREFEEVDVAILEGGVSNFTKDQMADLMTEYIVSGTLPVLLVDGVVKSYPAAMKELKWDTK